MANPAKVNKRKTQLLVETRALLKRGAFTANEIARLLNYKYGVDARIIAQLIRINMNDVKRRKDRREVTYYIDRRHLVNKKKIVKEHHFVSDSGYMLKWYEKGDTTFRGE